MKLDVLYQEISKRIRVLKILSDFKISYDFYLMF